MLICEPYCDDKFGLIYLYKSVEAIIVSIISKAKTEEERDILFNKKVLFKPISCLA